MRERRAKGKALELPEIMHLGMHAQHGASHEGKSVNRGFQVINELESVDGVLQSRYWLRHDPERDGGAAMETAALSDYRLLPNPQCILNGLGHESMPTVR